jgi:hypothetical protein
MSYTLDDFLQHHESQAEPERSSPEASRDASG